MWAKASILAALQLGGAVLALPADQEPFQDAGSSGASKVQAELQKAEIIPTVIDDFLPLLLLSVSWGKEEAELGNTIDPTKLQDRPSVSLYDDSGSDVFVESNISYVITMTDPDAPSRDDPKWSEMCHWIAANVSLSKETYSILPVPLFSSQNVEGSSNPDDVVEYKPPGPPPKTSKHRYVFLVFVPSNGTTDPLDLEAPSDRQHWGTGREGGGVRDWAESNGLVPIAANFIYSQNKKQ